MKNPALKNVLRAQQSEAFSKIRAKSNSKALQGKKGLERFNNFKLAPCKECGSTKVHTHQ